MPLQRLIIVQPCYSLEDLPRNLDAESATDFHACWTALWHPKFLRKIPNLPEWKRSDTSSLDVQQSLILLPEAAKNQVDTTLRERLDLNENTVVASAGSRSENIVQIAKLLEIDLEPTDTDGFKLETDRQVTDDQSTPARTPVCIHSFYALGFAYQQLHILTRKVHYSNNLDLMLFQEQITKAANAYCDGDKEEAEKWLQSSFDQLSQERDRYFSQQANLIDLTLLATTTLGDALTKQLKRPHAQNLLASASLLKQAKDRNSSAFELVQQRVNNGNLDLVGGMARESASPWLSSDVLLRTLANGRSEYERLGLIAPRVFSRLTGGTQSHDAQLLRISGMPYAMLSSWLDGEVPRSDQAKIRWQSADSTTIDAISGFVLDGESSLSVLSLGVELAKQFDYHQVPTLILAHWPNRYCEAFTELMLVTERSSALGSWKRCDDYFETTGQAYSNTSLTSTQFKFPLPEDQEAIREFCKAWQLCASLNGRSQFLNSAALLAGQLGQWMSRKSMLEKLQQDARECAEIEQQIDLFTAGVIDLFRSEMSVKALGEPPVEYDAPALTARANSLSQSVGENLTALVSGKNPTSASQSSGTSGEDRLARMSSVVLPTGKATYLINPQSVPMRYFLRSGSVALNCADASRVYAQEHTSSARKLMESGQLGKIDANGIGGNEVIVDVSACGVVQLSGSKNATTGSGSKLGLAHSNLGMANEYLDVQIDAGTGYLRSLLVTRKRGSRMSGQLSIASPEKLTGGSAEASQQYAVAKNVKITIEHNSTLSAIIASRGSLVHQGQELAEFEIWYELWRGSRMLQITPKIKWKVSPPSGLGLWEGAPVWRSAWPNDASSLRTWQQDMSTKVSSATIFSPQVLEIDDAEHRLYLMNSGACLHRRRQSTYLDTHLGTGHDASLLVGLDVPNPLQHWQHWTQPNWVVDSDHPMANDQASASFLSCSQKGVILRWIDPDTYFAKPAPETDAESSRRFDAYLFVQETAAKASNARIQFFRDVKKAAKVNFTGCTDELLTIEGGDVLLPLRTCESVWVGVDWLQ